MFVDRIQEQGWYGLVYGIVDVNVFYCLDLFKKFYINIDPLTININLNQFTIYFDSGDIIKTADLIHGVTHILIPPLHAAPLALID